MPLNRKQISDELNDAYLMSQLNTLENGHGIYMDYNGKFLSVLNEALEQLFYRFRVNVRVFDGQMEIKPIRKLERKV